ncbi:uncharacterized protein BO97DRAFT_452973 [Aspergillus homomorphus CBS 101889]|uniref:Uncharacterized protein n=1 Tax=Aspergillus homomorphus (strain CBS 101889) TaxID=1450537 RepID=A0A395ICV5_ASPHC|nr:hypothetical protein BO97DRAFT_452973 [Aspergillus homomorphus CBS 101889]RAL16968.1 hypothetical protein BO97DRAFT_452973 [Aspergillus homomorphus CBS 101889]
MPHRKLPASYPGDNWSSITETNDFLPFDSAYESDSTSRSSSHKHTRGATRTSTHPFPPHLDRMSLEFDEMDRENRDVSTLFTFPEGQLHPSGLTVLDSKTTTRLLTPLYLLHSASQAGKGDFLTGRVTVCEESGVDLARILKNSDGLSVRLDATCQVCVRMDAILRTLGRSKNKITYTIATAILAKSTSSLLHLTKSWDIAGLIGSLVAITFAIAADYTQLPTDPRAATTYQDILAHALLDRDLAFSHIRPVAVSTTDNSIGALGAGAEDKLEEFVIQDLDFAGSTTGKEDIHVTWYRNNNRVVFRLLPPGQDAQMTSGEALALGFWDGVGLLVSYGIEYLSELGTEDEDELAVAIARAWTAGPGALGDERGGLIVSSIEKGVEYVSLYVDIMREEDGTKGLIEVTGEMEGFL